MSAIIEAAARAICVSLEEDPDALDTPYEIRGWRLYRSTAIAALRAALPWDPSPKTVETIAHAYSTDWDSASRDQRRWWYLKSLEAYRAQPIMHELYPEQFPEKSQ